MIVVQQQPHVFGGDDDQPYTFGQPRQRADGTGPFTLRQLARLTILRSRIGDTVASTQPVVLS